MSVISKVVLYKHGVGYFERVATVVGDEEVRLSFKADEMNDVLKSLTVFDSAGDGVSSVSYDNQQPISRILDESSLSLGLAEAAPYWWRCVAPGYRWLWVAEPLQVR